ncbi:MAG: phage portal protein, partial [Nitrospira sp.]|nr:phage portal protein [Nitrospira sp.]
MSLFGMFEQRSAEKRAATLTNDGLLRFFSGPANASGKEVTATSSLTMPAVWRAVNIIANVSASIPLHTFANGSKTPQTSRLLDNPHPDLTAYEFWRLSYVHRCLYGNFYAQKIRDRVGRVVELWPISPDKVQVGRVAPSEANPSGKIFKINVSSGKSE